MSLFRYPFLLSAALAALLATGPVCLANKPAYIPKFDPPVQNYAVIDLSGNTTTMPVDRVALNDANQVAFGFPTGSIPSPYFFGGDAQYHVYTWSNGTLSPEHIINGYTTAIDPASGNLYQSTRFEVEDLLSSGLAYGYLDNLSSNGTDYDTIGFAQAGDPGSIDAPSPPFDNYFEDLHGTFCQGATENGVLIGGIDEAAIGNDGYPWRYGCSFLMKDGIWTIFDAENDYSITTVPANVVIEPMQFEPTAANNQGQAIGFSGGGPWDGGMFWDGQKTIPVGPGYASDLNDQGQVSIQGYHNNTPNTEGAMWEGGDQIMLRDQLPFWFQWQDWDIQPFSISNQVKVGQPPVPPALPDPTADATIHLLTTAQGVDVGAYGTMLWTRDNSGHWSFANVALPAGTSITDWTSINSSGVIAAIGNGGHALLLLPVQLTQTNYPTNCLADGTDQGQTGSQIISSGTSGSACIAYITGSPAMPTLQVALANGSLSGMNVQWWMTVTSDRPSVRGSLDNVQIPLLPAILSPSDSVTLPINQAWEIDNYYSGLVFGGNAIIHYLIEDGNGNAVTPEQQFPFLIRGRNPMDANAKQYIQNHEGNFYYAWAIAQHESRTPSKKIYNQFATANGSSWGDLGQPFYSPLEGNGWGMFQRDATGNGIAVTTDQVYSWQANTQVAIAELTSKQAAQQRFFNAVANAYPKDPEAQNPPASYPAYNGSSTNMSALDMGTITLYNSADGCPHEWSFQNPWHFNENAPKGHKWSYTGNVNNYLYHVIHDEYEGHLSIAE